MTRLRHFRDLLQREPWWTEVWSGIAAIAWSKWVLWQPEDLAGRDPYRVIAGLASDATWEWIGFAVGVAQLGATGLDCRWARLGMAFLAAWFWFVLAYGLWLGNRSAPGAALYLTYGGANVASLVLLTVRRAAR